MPKKPQPRRQETPQELLDFLLDFLERKFYAGRPVIFAKDRRRLLEWVVLWPAVWFRKRGVTVPPDRYREIFLGVFMDALSFGDVGNITYLPAYLAKVIQSHFDCHGDELYEQAKSARALAEHAMMVLGKIPQPASDPVGSLAQAAQASRLLRSKKRSIKPPVNSQLNLL
jgi:hypothetical protein